MSIAPRTFIIDTFEKYAAGPFPYTAESPRYVVSGSYTNITIQDYKESKKLYYNLSAEGVRLFCNFALSTSELFNQVKQNVNGLKWKFEIDFTQLPLPTGGSTWPEFIWVATSGSPTDVAAKKVIRFRFNLGGLAQLIHGAAPGTVTDLEYIPLNTPKIFQVLFVSETTFYVQIGDNIYGSPSSPFTTYDSNPAFGGSIYVGNDVATFGGVATYKWYLDNIMIEQPSNGMQIGTFTEKTILDPSNFIEPSRSIPIHTDHYGYRYVIPAPGKPQKVWRWTGSETWTEETAFAGVVDLSDSIMGSCMYVQTTPTVENKFHRIFYYGYDPSGTPQSKIKYSINLGLWISSPILNQRLVDMVFRGYTGDGSNTMVAATITEAGGVTTLRLHDFTYISNAWTVIGTWTIPTIIKKPTGKPYCFKLIITQGATPNSAYYYIIYTPTGETTSSYYRLDGGGVLTFIKIFTGYQLSDDHRDWPALSDRRTEAVVSFNLFDGSNTWITYTTRDGGVTWASETFYPVYYLHQNENHFISIQSLGGVSSYQLKNTGISRLWFLKPRLSLMAAPVDVPAYYWNQELNHGFKILAGIYTPYYFLGISSDGKAIFTNFLTNGTRLFEFGFTYEDTFKIFDIIKECTEKPTEASILINPDDLSKIPEGEFIEVYDGFNNLAFVGKSVNPISTNQRSNYMFKAVALDYDLYKKGDFDFKVVTTKSMAVSLINGLNFVYQNNSIDPNNDFITTYNRRVADQSDKVINFFRFMERAVFWSNPDGLVTLKKYNRLDIFPSIRFFDESHPQCKLIDYQEIDLRLTRSEVSGGSNSLGQVRRVYVGNAALESTEGITITQLNDPKVMNAPECLQIATNRYNIFVNQGSDKSAIRFIKIRLEGQGLLPIGAPVDFSWVDDNITIPRKRYLVFGYDAWDLRNDINVVILTDGIVSLKEATGAARQAGRDDPLTGTYYDGTKESTVTGVPVYQQPVSNLRAGTYIWRYPEATNWDYNSQTAPPTGNVPNIGVAGWRILPLAAIVPEGARAVHVSILFQDSPAGNWFWLRKPGGTGTFQVTGGYVSTNNTDFMADLVCGINEAREIEAYFSQAPNLYTYWRFVVLGWWI